MVIAPQEIDGAADIWQVQCQRTQRAIQMCRIEFGIPDDGCEAVVWLGDHPETVFESHLGRHNIYLGRDSDRWQFMYSGSHEAFHRVCGERKNAMHWADEMFAIFFSLLYLERIGEIAHADKNRIGLIDGAQRISRQEMLAATQGPCPMASMARRTFLARSCVKSWGGRH